MNSELERIVGAPVPRETSDKLREYLSLLLSENDNQNLIARSTVEDAWERHILDSAQLVPLLEEDAQTADIGTGAGLPGIVLAILTDQPITLIEPRRLRVEFLERVRSALGLTNLSLLKAKAQSATGQFDVMTARAVAHAGEIFGITRHLAHKRTTYLLMKGRKAQSELDEVRAAWQGDFELVASKTDPDAGIIVARNIAGRARG